MVAHGGWIAMTAPSACEGFSLGFAPPRKLVNTPQTSQKPALHALDTYLISGFYPKEKYWLAMAPLGSQN